MSEAAAHACQAMIVVEPWEIVAFAVAVAVLVCAVVLALGRE